MSSGELRYAARSLSRSPGFAAAAVLTLALGVGANTAIFSAIDEALLRPWPLPRPDRLAQVYSFNRKTASYVSSSYPDYQAFAARARSFRQLSAYVRMPLNVAAGDGTARIPLEAVTGNYFTMLELRPAAGRVFRAEDDLPASVPPAMIGEDLWLSRFGGDAGAIGKTIRIEDHPFLVVGVVPKRYRGMNLNWGDVPQVWIPLAAAPLAVPRFASIDIFHLRVPWLVIVGRLEPGASVERAQAELQTVAADLARAEPATNRDLTAVVFSASRARFWPSYRGQVTRSLAAFAVAAGLVLLLACSNVSNLLVARALNRRREFAIRLSLGASRRRLVWQLLAESLLLAAPSFACALLVASALGKVLLHFPNALGLPLALSLPLEGRVLAFCGLVSVAATVLFGLAPALQATRPDMLPALKESGNSPPGSGHYRLRHGLVAAQVAFSAILLTGGGVFARSLLKAYAIDLGFRSANLLTLNFSTPPPGASAGRIEPLQQALLRDLAALPGVQSAALADGPPLNPIHSRVQVLETAGGAPLAIDRSRIGPGFLRTVGIALAAGREFASGDGEAAAKVAIVNQTLAARLWPGEIALGRVLPVQERPGRTTGYQVIGVARDAKYASVWEQPQPYLYVPLAEADGPGGCLLVRTAAPPEALIPAIRERWDRIAPRIPLYDIRTGDERVNVLLAPQRMAAGILGAFALLAVALSAIGIYSAMAYGVAERRREIGIRMALGARPEAVVRQMLARSLVLAGTGLAAGALLGAALMRLIAAQVKDVSPYDPSTFAAVALLLAAVSVAATLVPARRAAAIDPHRALQCE